jgi:hypothetical protein
MPCQADLKAEESRLTKIDLYTEIWWDSPMGMQLTVVPEIVDVFQTLVTKLEIKKTIFDINDFHKNCYKA